MNSNRQHWGEGGCTLLYDDIGFKVSKNGSLVPEWLELNCVLFSFLSITPNHKLKRLVVGLIYVRPKQETAAHIIEKNKHPPESACNANHCVTVLWDVLCLIRYCFYVLSMNLVNLKLFWHNL